MVYAFLCGEHWSGQRYDCAVYAFSVRVSTDLANDDCVVCGFLCEKAVIWSMIAWYAFVRCFLVWRIKEGNAARERTNAPINRARRIKACSPRMQNTKPLDPWYHCHSSNWSWFCVCQVCDRHRYEVKYREISI